MSEPIRVLHVDDEPDFVELAATFLEREDVRFEVETATSAAAGLECLDEAVDCIVSDYDMPGTNGIEFLQTVRESHPDLPFILFTGKGSEEVASDAISAGVTDYLQKETGSGQYTVLANRITNAVEQYRSKHALEASQKRLSLFIEQSPLGVVEWDENFQVVHLNDTAESILGYAEEELRGESWEPIVPGDDHDAVDEVVTDLLENRGGYHSVNENVRKDGERIVCEWHNRVVTHDDEVVAIFSQFQDVTDRRERAEKLRRTTARLEALFENSPDMINVHDTEGNIIDPNPRIQEKTGYDATELTDMKVWEVDEASDPDRARTLWEDMETGEQRKWEGRFQRRDGTTFPVEVHLRSLDLDGDDRFVAISRDISERKHHQRELEAAKEHLDTVVSNVPIVLFALDSDGVFTLSEGKGLEALGMDPGEVVGESVFDLYAGYPNIVEPAERALDGEEVRTVTEVAGQHFETAYQPVFDGEKVSHVIGVATVITESKEKSLDDRD